MVGILFARGQSSPARRFAGTASDLYMVPTLKLETEEMRIMYLPESQDALSDKRNLFDDLCRRCYISESCCNHKSNHDCRLFRRTRANVGGQISRQIPAYLPIVWPL